jgi:hypothetical protein
VDDQHFGPRAGFRRRALLRAGLLIALTVGILLAVAAPGTTSAKDRYTYFAEAFSYFQTDAAGVQTSVSVVAIDHPTRPDEVALEVNRSDPACRAPDAGCPYVLVSGYAVVPVAEGDVRIQPNLRWARVATTITFAGEVSGTSCAATLHLTWRATSEFHPDGDDAVGFRTADAVGTVTCGGEELLGGQVDGTVELSRFILPD